MHIVLAGGGFVLHPFFAEPLPDMVSSLNRLLRLAAQHHGLYVPATLSQVLVAWVTLIDRFDAAMRELRVLCSYNLLDEPRRPRPSKIPQAIMMLHLSLRRKLPKDLLDLHSISIPSTRPRSPARVAGRTEFCITHTATGRAVMVETRHTAAAMSKETESAEFRLRSKYEELTASLPPAEVAPLPHLSIADLTLEFAALSDRAMYIAREQPIAIVDRGVDAPMRRFGLQQEFFPQRPGLFRHRPAVRLVFALHCSHRLMACLDETRRLGIPTHSRFAQLGNDLASFGSTSNNSLLDDPSVYNDSYEHRTRPGWQPGTLGLRGET
ncbi:hypothetical protein C8F04DRAFT_1273781 [Mycena alexandri]|uniref:Uncharacterized protein n=1 Tax=Mycena alexandri TaxID=1745969 RepID=A0AAD6S5P2_9AGAR|nr:hypothetical protein C8F04DRAFT_1273781 [Mycena alexandri]